jgi:uncharacterized protein (TIGR02596 family)
MSSSPEYTYRSGFTLIEMLCVLAVISILMTLAAPATSEMFTASRLTKSGDTVFNALSEAQFAATTRGIDVEVRFYEETNPSGGTPTTTIQRVQLFTPQSPDSLTAQDTTTESSEAQPWVSLSGIYLLDQGMVISEQAPLTSLITLATQNDNESPDKLKYWSFLIRSDGTTNLSPAQKWFLTVLDARNSTSNRLPKNFITIQIDPVTARLRTFRPG